MPARILLIFFLLSVLPRAAIAQNVNQNVRSKALSTAMQLLETSQLQFDQIGKELAHHLSMAYFGENNPLLESRFANALTAIGNSLAIKSVAWTTDTTLPQLQSSDMKMVTLCVDNKELLSELAAIFDSCSGERGKLKQILDGIANDSSGPMIDVENEFIRQLGDTWVVCNETSQLEFRWLIAIKIKGQKKVSDVVDRFFRNEPDSKIVAENIYIAENGLTAMLFDDWLLIGNDNLVQEVAPRLSRSE